MASVVKIEVAPGELIDKLTILEIKRERIGDAAKLANVHVEYEALRKACDAAVPQDEPIPALWRELREVNTQLWEIEDHIRDCERNGDFGPRFIELARSVYRTNDRRAELKRAINLALGSTLIEEKSYAAY